MAGKFRQAKGYILDKMVREDGKYLLQISLMYALYKNKDFANSKKIGYTILEKFET